MRIIVVNGWNHLKLHQICESPVCLQGIRDPFGSSCSNCILLDTESWHAWDTNRLLHIICITVCAACKIWVNWRQLTSGTPVCGCTAAPLQGHVPPPPRWCCSGSWWVVWKFEHYSGILQGHLAHAPESMTRPLTWQTPGLGSFSEPLPETLHL